MSYTFDELRRYIASLDPDEEVGKNQFRCSSCRGVFDKGITDEEAMQEKERDFGDYPLSNCVIVCDDCYKAIFN